MRRLTKLWQALECIEGLATTIPYWEHHCGLDYPIVRPFLRPTDLTGATYPCQDHCVPGCYRDVVDYGGEIVAVCHHRFFRRPDIPLTQADMVVHQLDLSSFTRALSRPLGFRWHAAVERADGAWAIGFIRNTYGVEQPLVLLVHTERHLFRAALKELLADSVGCFALLAPTIQFKDAEIHESLARHEIRFQSLEESIGVDDSDQLVGMQSAEADTARLDAVPVTPVVERVDKTRAFLARHGLTIKELLGTLRIDYRDFKRWRKGELPDTSTKSKKIESFLQVGPIAVKRTR